MKIDEVLPKIKEALCNKDGLVPEPELEKLKTRIKNWKYVRVEEKTQSFAWYNLIYTDSQLTTELQSFKKENSQAKTGQLKTSVLIRSAMIGWLFA